MRLKDISEKKEDSLEGFGVLIMIAGIIGGLVGIVTAINTNDYFFFAYGAISFLSACLINSCLSAIAENHCMLRNLTVEKLKQIDNKEQENKDTQKV